MTPATIGQRIRWKTPVAFVVASLFFLALAYIFDGSGRKILIAVPVAGHVLGERRNCPLDTGDRVGEYQLCTGTGFLNALERGCLGM